MFQPIIEEPEDQTSEAFSESGTIGDHWKCSSCLLDVPFGFAHICSAKTKQDQSVPMFPSELSLVEVNKKLDKVLGELTKIKEDVEKIKEKQDE